MHSRRQHHRNNKAKAVKNDYLIWPFTGWNFNGLKNRKIKATPKKEKSLSKDTWTLCADVQINTKASEREKGQGISEVLSNLDAN